MIEDALAGFTGGAFVPDYANMETQNRITSWGGTWTADRTGFVCCQFGNGSSGLAGSVSINDAGCDSIITSGGGHATKTVLAVAAGDVVKIGGANYGNVTPRCYFIPPKTI